MNIREYLADSVRFPSLGGRVFYQFIPPGQAARGLCATYRYVRGAGGQWWNANHARKVVVVGLFDHTQARAIASGAAPDWGPLIDLRNQVAQGVGLVDADTEGEAVERGSTELLDGPSPGEISPANVLSCQVRFVYLTYWRKA